MIGRRDGVEYSTTLAEGEFKMPNSYPYTGITKQRLLYKHKKTAILNNGVKTNSTSRIWQQRVIIPRRFLVSVVDGKWKDGELAEIIAEVFEGTGLLDNLRIDFRRCWLSGDIPSAFNFKSPYFWCLRQEQCICQLFSRRLLSWSFLNDQLLYQRSTSVKCPCILINFILS